MKARTLGQALLVIGAVLLAGCSAPGMRMDLSKADPDPPPPVNAATPLKAPELVEVDASVVASLDAEEAARARQREATRLTRRGEAPYVYKIGPYDVLRITVWDHPELNTPSAISSLNSQSNVSVVTGTPQTSSDFGRLVSNDGTMFYPYAGLIHVAGLTPLQVRTVIEKALSNVINDPQIEVVVGAYRSSNVYVTGEVKTPSVLPLTDVPMRVGNAILAAGGVSADAAPNEATLTRDGVSYVIDLYNMFNRGDQSQNVLLKANDVLNVPENRPNKIFTLGEVGKQSSIPVPPGRYTLSEALSDAGGPAQATANTAQVYVMRSAEDGKTEIYHVNMRSPVAFVLADQFPMYPRDVLYVDLADVSRWSRVVNQLIPSAGLINQSAALKY